jgi:hypothetical protein
MTDALNETQREADPGASRRRLGGLRHRGRGGLPGSQEAAYVTGRRWHVERRNGDDLRKAFLRRG